MSKPYSFFTDTASVAFLDPANLEHRMSDTCDWWCDPFEEREELLQGHIVTVSLGTDGDYELVRVEPGQSGCECANILITSGLLFAGRGEDIPGEDYFEPVPESMHKVEPGNYTLCIRRSKEDVARIEWWLIPSDTCTNKVHMPFSKSDPAPGEISMGFEV